MLDPVQHRGTLDHEEGPLKEGIDTTIGTAAHIGEKAQEYGSIAADKTKEVICHPLRALGTCSMRPIGARDVSHVQAIRGGTLGVWMVAAVWGR